MTLTNTVSSFAHDAAHTASDLASDFGEQAADFGRSAADIGLEAASSVASAASQLAHTLQNRLPAVHSKPKRGPWLLVVVAVVGVLGFVVLRKRSAKRAAESSAKVGSAADAGPRRTAMAS